MEFIKLIYPGLGLSVGSLLVILSFFQLKLYWRKGYERSKYLGIFCGLTSLFAFNIMIMFSGAFSDEFTRFFCEGLQWVLFLTFYFYLRCLSFFLAIPRWIKRFYYPSMLIMAGLAAIPYPWYLLTGQYLYFDPNVHQVVGNYFVDTYLERLGVPGPIPVFILSFGSFLNVILTFYVLNRIQKSSKDIFLIIGMVFTLFSSAMDFLFLPIIPYFHIPLLFMSNVFEAMRMCYLAAIEDYYDSTELNPKTKKEIKESQHNLTIDEEQLEKLSKHLVSLLEDEQVYRDPNLKIETLAKKMRVPGYIVSQVFRFGLDTNFTTLIGKYRVEYVKGILQDRRQNEHAILEIANQAGFNSKSSFNQIFKKAVGETPSQYRKRIQSN